MNLKIYKMKNPAVGHKMSQSVNFLEGLTFDKAKTPEGLVITYFGK